MHTLFKKFAPTVQYNWSGGGGVQTPLKINVSGGDALYVKKIICDV